MIISPVEEWKSKEALRQAYVPRDYCHSLGDNNTHWYISSHKSPVESVVMVASRLYYRLWVSNRILGHDFEKWS